MFPSLRRNDFIWSFTNQKLTQPKNYCEERNEQIILRILKNMIRMENKSLKFERKKGQCLNTPSFPLEAICLIKRKYDVERD